MRFLIHFLTICFVYTASCTVPSAVQLSTASLEERSVLANMILIGWERAYFTLQAHDAYLHTATALENLQHNILTTRRNPSKHSPHAYIPGELEQSAANMARTYEYFRRASAQYELLLNYLGETRHYPHASSFIDDLRDHMRTEAAYIMPQAARQLYEILEALSSRSSALQDDLEQAIESRGFIDWALSSLTSHQTIVQFAKADNAFAARMHDAARILHNTHDMGMAVWRPLLIARLRTLRAAYAEVYAYTTYGQHMPYIARIHWNDTGAWYFSPEALPHPDTLPVV